MQGGHPKWNRVLLKHLMTYINKTVKNVKFCDKENTFFNIFVYLISALSRGEPHYQSCKWHGGRVAPFFISKSVLFIMTSSMTQQTLRIVTRMIRTTIRKGNILFNISVYKVLSDPYRCLYLVTTEVRNI